MTQCFLTPTSERSSGRDRIPSSLSHPTLSFRPDREPIRHLLIGSPDVVQRTINHLHHLHYTEANFWSPAITLSSEEIVLTLTPDEILRILVRQMPVNG